MVNFSLLFRLPVIWIGVRIAFVLIPVLQKSLSKFFLCTHMFFTFVENVEVRSQKLHLIFSAMQKKNDTLFSLLFQMLINYLSLSTHCIFIWMHYDVCINVKGFNLYALLPCGLLSGLIRKL